MQLTILTISAALAFIGIISILAMLWMLSTTNRLRKERDDAITAAIEANKAYMPMRKDRDMFLFERDNARKLYVETLNELKLIEGRGDSLWERLRLSKIDNTRKTATIRRFIKAGEGWRVYATSANRMKTGMIEKLNYFRKELIGQVLTDDRINQRIDELIRAANVENIYGRHEPHYSITLDESADVPDDIIGTHGKHIKIVKEEDGGIPIEADDTIMCEGCGSFYAPGLGDKQRCPTCEKIPRLHVNCVGCGRGMVIKSSEQPICDAYCKKMKDMPIGAPKEKPPYDMKIVDEVSYGPFDLRAMDAMFEKKVEQEKILHTRTHFEAMFDILNGEKTDDDAVRAMAIVCGIDPTLSIDEIKQAITTKMTGKPYPTKEGVLSSLRHGEDFRPCLQCGELMPVSFDTLIQICQDCLIKTTARERPEYPCFVCGAPVKTPKYFKGQPLYCHAHGEGSEKRAGRHVHDLRDERGIPIEDDPPEEAGPFRNNPETGEKETICKGCHLWVSWDVNAIDANGYCPECHTKNAAFIDKKLGQLEVKSVYCDACAIVIPIDEIYVAGKDTDPAHYCPHCYKRFIL